MPRRVMVLDEATINKIAAGKLWNVLRQSSRSSSKLDRCRETGESACR